MKLLFKVGWSIVIFLGLFLILRTYFFSVPSLGKKEELVHRYNQEGRYYFKIPIKLDTLYKAKTITAKIRFDEDYANDFNIKLRISFMSGESEIISSKSILVNPDKDDNLEHILTFDFNQFTVTKINYLIKDIDRIYLIFSDFDQNKRFNAEIEELYLQ